jgi:type II secretory pathway pseudopilin PulG
VKFFPTNLDFETARTRRRTAFTLVEILVAMVLMTFIVLALMTVFNSTQTAFRAGLTQTDVLESGRATMDLIQSDLQEMTPSLDYTNGAVNFCITTNLISGYSTSPYSPLYQSLPAVINPNTQRTNLLESFFILSRGNVNGSDSWIGTGYAVMLTNSQYDLYPLYRFTTNYPVVSANPARLLYGDFQNFLATPTNYDSSHLMDGVVHLRVRAFDMNGAWIGDPNSTNRYNNIYTNYLLNVPGEAGLIFYSNAVPASVEVEMGVLEDKTLEHAESLNSSFTAQTNYLAQHVGQVHIFRQRIQIRNVDPSAYK